MKKLIIGIMLFIAIGLTATSNVEIISQNSNLIEFKIHFQIDADNPFVLSYIPQESYISTEYGVIPYYKYNFIIPDYNSVDVVYQVTDTLYTYDYYDNSDSLAIPNKAIIASDPYIFRDFRGITINFYPYHFDNKQSSLIIYKEVTVKIITNTDTGINPLHFHHDDIPMIFHNVYKRFFENYSYFESNNIIAEKCVVIFTEQTENDAQRYTDFLTQSGIKSDSYLYPQDTGMGIYGLKNFILNIYKENPDFTFLTFISASENDFIWENNYSFFMGDDTLPELISANLSEIDTTKINIALNGIFNIHFKFDDIDKNQIYRISQNENDNNAEIIFADTYEKNRYILSLNKDEYQNLYNLSDRIINSKEELYFSEIPLLFSVFQNKAIKNHINPVYKINKNIDDPFKMEISVVSDEPIVLIVNTYQNYRPLQNCLVSVIDDNAVLQSKYSDEFGRTEFEFADDLVVPTLKITSFNKETGLFSDFAIIHNKNTVVKDTTAFLHLYPNPYYLKKSKSNLCISFELQKDAFISATIYNIVGQNIKNLYNGFKSSGTHIFYWDGKDNTGKTVTTGVYYIMVKYDDKTEIKKVLIVK